MLDGPVSPLRTVCALAKETAGDGKKQHVAFPGSGLPPGNAYRTLAGLLRRCVMKRFVVSLVAVVIGVALLGAFPALVGAHHHDGVRFQGSADLTQTSAQQLPHNNTLLTFAGTGTATPIGQFSEDAVVVIHADGSFQAIVVLTDANGNQVFKSAQGASISEGFFTVNGGTGPYTSASGVGIVKHTSSDNFAHVHQTFHGTIRY
jgi:hypothetical protein